MNRTIQIINIILIIIITIYIIVPFFVTMYNSLCLDRNPILSNFNSVFASSEYLSSSWNSIKVSFYSSILCVIFSIILSYLAWQKRFIIPIFVAILVLVLIPGNIQALGIKYMSIYLFEINVSKKIFLIYSLVLKSLPFAFVLSILGFYSINNNLMVAASDLNSNRLKTFLKILLPLLFPFIVSSFLFSFLLSLNEFSRVYYLKGSTKYLSNVINGELASGVSANIFAIGSINVIFAFVVFLMSMIFLGLKNKEKSTEPNNI